MHGDIRDYAKVGIAHFMFWPDCLSRTAVMLDSLPRALARTDIEVVDCCLPFDRAARATLVQQARQSNKHLGYAIHPFPLDKISLGADEDHLQDLIRMVMRDQLEAAAAMGAQTFTIASGIDPGADLRPAALERFTAFCRWLSAELARAGMIGLIEPFDRRGYRNFLLGPIDECVALLEALRPQVSNLRLQLDVAHLRLQAEHLSDALTKCGQYLGHVHLGNCVTRDRADPFHGDRHPPIGYSGGDIGVTELGQVLRDLLEAGYLNTRQRPTLVIEARPVPGSSPEDTIENQLRHLELAWERL